MERSLSDPKLGEVRAVLERLQTFAADPDGTQPPAQASNGAGVNGYTTSAHQSGTQEPVYELPAREPAEYDLGNESAGKRRAPAAIGLGIAGMVVILLGVIWLIVSPGDRGELSAAVTPDVTPAGRAISERDTSVKQPEPPVRHSRAGIDAAQDLLSKGQVQAARKQLLGLASADTADVAWMLARSYDPNFLISLPSADGRPDIEQATRWYRIWHAAAVKQGLVPNSVSVDRIIGSMR
jgi:hypothetical protein